MIQFNRVNWKWENALKIENKMNNFLQIIQKLSIESVKQMY